MYSKIQAMKERGFSIRYFSLMSPGETAFFCHNICDARVFCEILLPK